MKDNHTILALIPARKGSKGILNKNIKTLAGQPLIYYTIQAALHSRYIDRVIVSTDSEEIARIARTHGADVPFLRPAQFAADHSPTHDTILHTLHSLNQEQQPTYDLICLLQPTSPLRTTTHIDQAIEHFSTHPAAHLLVSVTPFEKNPHTIKTMANDGYLADFFSPENTPAANTFTPRQEFPPLFLLNGAIYIARSIDILQEHGLPRHHIIPFLMDNIDSVDIDNEVDFLFAQYLITVSS